VKRVFIGIFTITAMSLQGMQKQEQREPLRQHLLEQAGDVELGALASDAAAAPMAPSAADVVVVVEQMPATPTHVAGSASADASPDRDENVVDVRALLTDASLRELFERAPALKKILESHENRIEINEQKMQQIFDIVEQLREADVEHSLPKKKRAIATALELGILTPCMMLYTYFLDRGGYNTAAIVQHYTAGSWLRNFSDLNPFAKMIAALVSVGVAQGIDYHVAIPYLGNALGLAPMTLFIALGLILSEIRKVNSITKTKETICQSAARLGHWFRSLRGRSRTTADQSNV
jgi:hypothetical protein